MKKLGIGLLVVLSLVGVGAIFESSTPKSTDKKTLEQWIGEQKAFSIRALKQNLSPGEGMAGAAIASPEKLTPPYFYHWLRDSALNYLTVARLVESGPKEDRDGFLQNFFAFADFSAHIQKTSPNLGEPKFYVTGEPYRGNWCRPQNDGPALRAIALMELSEHLQSHQPSDRRIKIFASTVSKDVDYVVAHWREPNCDLWEESVGDHFYTRMVQRRALLMAAKKATALGMSTASLVDHAEKIGNELQKHWNAKLGYFVATINSTGGVNYKTSNLDSSIILGVLHGHTDDGFMNYLDPKLLATAQVLDKNFRTLYPINSNSDHQLGVAIGRYPEDKYEGNPANKRGNPWVLLTAAMAQFYYRAQMEATRKGDTTAAVKYLNLGDAYLRRIQFHAPSGGDLSEQIDRESGTMTSASNLTWSHTEILDAFAAREQVHEQRRSAAL